jgi:hypothetical protein
MPLNVVEPVFDSADLAVLQQAYDEACREIGVDPNPADKSLHKEAREALASFIIKLAAGGLRDPRILKARALRTIRLKPRALRIVKSPTTAGGY